MEIVIGIVVVAGLAVGGYLIFGRKPKEEEPEYCYYHCTKCKRRMRYLEKQGGQRAACPTCKEPFIFPVVPPSGLSKK